MVTTNVGVRHEVNGSEPTMVSGDYLQSDAGPPPAGDYGEDIAIIGMSCKAPGDCTSPEKLWELCVAGRNAWRKIPDDRFSQTAFYHPQGEHPGRSNVLGAHFLDEDTSLFDASFFGLSTEVASSMDPQFRLQLESTFEALENAGIPLSKAAGSSTAVFAGSFFRDYYDSFMRDPGTFPRYCLTGNGAAMLSNRVSHFFDLRGPSVTVDTGCSTGLTALHLACQSLRTKESSMAVVGGANVLLNPDNFIAMSCLGFLGPTGKSYSFDDRAEGYGRGEGVATIVIKPLSVAVSDGDTVRAVIKATLLNQDGKTPTITSPSQRAQETLIRQCYANCGLDPKDTAYVEAHGTGTKAGDPVEFRALSNVFTPGRSPDVPLYLSSLKANVGHLESASGIAAVIKAALALEHGVIPPSANFEQPNPQFGPDITLVRVPTSPVQWPSNVVKRASINNFGYGGTNAHVIMEESPVPKRHKHTGDGRISATKMNGANSITPVVDGFSHGSGAKLTTMLPRVFILSAKDENVAQQMRARLAAYLFTVPTASTAFLDRLAYTLSERRSRFNWTSAVSAETAPRLQNALEAPQGKPRYAPAVPRVAFVFNGQGAQWYAMGRELIGTYEAFADALRRAEQCLRDMGARWSLLEELSRDEAESRVNEPTLSMALSTSVQLALVDLLRSWGITPTAVTGHSSGEAAAAYAAGAIDFNSAVAVSYFRGLLTQKYQMKLNLRGAMMAVGLGPEEATSYLDKLQCGRAMVACVNSPTSVTLSGDDGAITELEAKLAAEKVFARRLKVSAAYHSHHMLPQVDEYLALLSANFTLTPQRYGDVRYSSPVSGQTMWAAQQLGPGNWVDNMTKPVLFAQALTNMCYGQTHADKLDMHQLVDTIIEIGPHSALAGPVRQTLCQPQLKALGITYASCLERNRDAVMTMQNLACTLLTQGYPVQVMEVNMLGSRHQPSMLSDLPSYPWNHSKSYWMEPRLNKEHRFRQHQPHDLLGSLVLGGNGSAPIWRYIMTPSQLPWVRDHIVQSEIVYPGAGFVAMAIEAYEQLHHSTGGEKLSYELTNITMKAALVIPDTAEGIEVQLRLEKRDERLLDWDTWWEFTVDSVDIKGKWQHHCSGSITRHNETHNAPILDVTKTVRGSRFAVSPDKFYGTFERLGIEYGSLFKNVSMLGFGDGVAKSEIQVADTASVMPLRYERPHVLHPSTLDALFQTAYATLPKAGQDLQVAMIPTKIGSVIVRPYLQTGAGSTISVAAIRHASSPRSFDTSLVAFTTAQTPAVEIGKLHCQAIGSSLAKQNVTRQLGICSTVRWRSDFTLIDALQYKKMLQMPPEEAELHVIADAKRASFYLIQDALAQLTQSDVQNLEWYHKRFFEWMLYQVELAEADDIAPRSSKWLKTSDGVRQMLIEKVAAASVSGEMAVRIGRNLLRILRKQIAPLELMLEDKLLYSYYQNALRINRSYAQVQRLMELIGHEKPRANILEIGGGTAGCTVPTLRALHDATNKTNPGFQSYTFTDVSSGFFEMAREKLAEWGSMITYKALDIEQPPEEQGFLRGGYDMVIACQVLHATKSMAKTMANVHSLLRPGGKLVLVETTQDALDVQIIFGTLPGWWLSEEAERKHSPSLSVDFWSRVLKQTGFSGLDCSVPDSEDAKNYSQSVMLSTALPSTEPQQSSCFAVIYTRQQPHQSWMRPVSAAIATLSGSRPLVLHLSEAATSVADRLCIIVDDVKQPLLANISRTDFDALRTMLSSAKGALWVHHGGAMESSQPNASLVQGLLRVLRFENNAKRFVSLDMDPSAEPFGAAAGQNVASVLRACFDDAEVRDAIESEYAERNGTILIPRLCEAIEESEAALTTTTDIASEMQPFIQGSREISMSIGTPGMLDTLHFTERPSVDHVEDDHVEIEARVFGLNFRDIMVAMGQLESDKMGFECSGTVRRVGKNVASIRPGDRVCALTRGDWATSNRVHQSSVVKIPETVSFETAASIPVVYVTAFYSLFTIGRLEQGESVLIHAAAGGVGQAAIALAKLAGAKIYATAGSQEKREFLTNELGIPADQVLSSRDATFAQHIMVATNGRGVDVVLNSLSGALLQATWRCIGKFGRFIEIGKKDLEQSKHLDMNPFTRAASFVAVDLLYLGEEKHRVVAKVMRSVFDLLAEGKIRQIQPVTVYPISRIGRAFRIMSQGKHMGKIVINAEPDDMVPVVPKRLPVTLRPDATYAVVGGLGGIGRSVSKMLAARGAKHLLLLSRSAGERPSDHELICELETMGCHALAQPCDIVSKDALTMAKSALQAHTMPPVRGVVQGAMVLDDSVFERMSYDNWCTAIKPKVDGTTNLHEQFQDLDFFVMLSSLIGTSGHSSQANYAAGSTFQDAFARWRASQGLPAVSLDLGFVQAVGYVAEREGVADRMAQMGYRQLSEEEVLNLIESAIRHPQRTIENSHIVTGIGAFDEMQTNVTWRQEPRFSSLRTVAQLSDPDTDRQASKGDGADGRNLTESLKKADSWTEAVEVITAAITTKLSEMFTVPEAEIDRSKPPNAYGVDSLVAVELRNWLFTRLQAELSIFEVLQSESLAALGIFTAGQSKLVKQAGLSKAA